MRVLIVLFALVVTPFLTGASQSPPGSAQPDVCPKPAALEPREDVQEAADVAHEDAEGDDDTECDQPNPPPTPPPAGTLAIDGTVFEDIVGSPGLGNWVVELSGTVTATALTNATTGRYVFTGLAPGTYTVCEVVQSGWRQTFPPQGTACLTGIGYTFTLNAGASASFVNFGNVRQ
jgi:hypothetical protein